MYLIFLKEERPALFTITTLEMSLQFRNILHKYDQHTIKFLHYRLLARGKKDAEIYNFCKADKFKLN